MGYRTSLLVLAFATVVSSPAASAAVLTVDTTADDATKSACDDNVANDCSLRGAIARANALSESSTINVPAGTYLLAAAAPCHLVTHQRGVFNISTASLCFAGRITLVGAGADATIFDAMGTHHVAYVSDGFDVEIRGVTLRKGFGAAEHDPAAPGFLTSDGGAVDNSGALTLVDSQIADSVAPNNGGAIYNDNTLTLRRTRLTGNTASGGGGAVMNASFSALTFLTIQDSTIALNQAATSLGGGVFNFGGVVSVTGSTISGNAAASLGGGLYNGNNSAAMEIVDSTISGNTSGSSGGGIENGSPNPIVLNNVTVTNNVGATQQRGSTGGITGGRYVMSNTVLAGNRDANGGTPDCFASVTSNGYNLIQGPIANCTITGDTTGNIVGQDPKLGFLADNGGATLTQTPAADSPVVDAGSPAVPGSGGSACAIADQRGLLRPLGARCDIGAVERSGAFVVTKLTPSTGGNAGQVTVQISGGGFADGAAVRLRRSGHSDIVGARTHVDVGGSSMATTFDLASATPGAWDVVVTNGDATTTTRSGGFIVTAGAGPSVWVDVIGMIRRHGPSTILILYGNRGDADAIGVPLSVSLPSAYAWTHYFDITPPPPQGEFRPDWTQVAESVGMPVMSDFLQVPLFLPVIPSGFNGALRLSLTLPANATNTSLFAAAGDPVFGVDSETAFIDQAVAGAQAYVSYGFGITVPDSVVTQLKQYATRQLQTMIANGQAAFTASLGTLPQVYSLGQLQIDLFLFIVPRVPTPAASSAGS